MPSRSTGALRRRLAGWAFVVVGCAVVFVAEAVGRAVSLGEIVMTEPVETAAPAEVSAD
ncbi:hypothetical protein [Curtobacterium luteum]|uniref:hypothetical protein n=1 Tax=Curtobacterium luteum TaxID=33881 RepID=UPI003824AB65